MPRSEKSRKKSKRMMKKKCKRLRWLRKKSLGM